MSPYHRPPFPTPDGLPSRGLSCPLQDPSSASHLLASVSRFERPVRLRGSVSVPIVPAPASPTAAPLSELRRREASDSGGRVTPVSPSSPRSRAESSRRAQLSPHSWGVTCIAGKPLHH
jgi:hypothetical protein